MHKGQLMILICNTLCCWVVGMPRSSVLRCSPGLRITLIRQRYPDAIFRHAARYQPCRSDEITIDLQGEIISRAMPVASLLHAGAPTPRPSPSRRRRFDMICCRSISARHLSTCHCRDACRMPRRSSRSRHCLTGLMPLSG